MRAWRVIWRGALALALAGAVAILLTYLAFIHLTGNFHTVIAGELYRSAQVTAGDVADYRERHGIRSILNLRGEAVGSDWYDAEVAAARGLGIRHADFRMSASKELGPDEAARLIALMRDLPKPLLIHCRYGSDRTGLATALYLAAITGVGEETAEGQLSIRFGHFAVPYLSDAWPMDASWERLEPQIGILGS